tara:strand:- start:1481 stop:3022 length:1542 start_codon:yes stop_codon:yes gene_type:complete
MSLDLGFYWAMLLRRLSVMMLFVLLFSGFGLVAAFKLPETYSTSARLLFEAPQIPSSMITPAVQAGAAEQLDIIEQRLMTRANLIDIANRFDVFENIRGMAPDRVFSAMRAATDIRRRGGARNGDRATMMTISFEGRSPQIVANVVNEYVTLVLQENSKFRVSRAENTLEFFEQEVKRLDEELNQRNVAIAVFNSENAKALPQDQPYRLGRQSLLQERLERLQRELVVVKKKRDQLELGFDGPVATTLNPYEEKLIVGRAELDRLTATYDQNNPRVIRLKDQIDRLEAIVAAGNETGNADTAGAEATKQGAMLEAAKAEADSEIAVLEAQISSTTTELEEIKKNISESGANAFQLSELQRDYEIILSRYTTAVSNLNSARMGERIEATAQGQRINVIENANVPQVPSGPDRFLVAAMGIFVGVGLAIGYFILLEVLNRSIRRPAELTERFDIKPIATIPYMETHTTKIVRRGVQVAALVAVLVCVPLALWYVDTYYLPLEVIVQRSLAKIGLS